jgi:LmbE family N-acetylglucosaminyl deacetylase
VRPAREATHGRADTPAGRGAADRFRRAARSVISTCARDVTGAAAERSALVLAPHPDDETLGCGATIARKLAAGTGVTVLAVTDGRHCHRSPYLPPDELGALRREELAEAMRRLGLHAGSLRWAELVDGAVPDAEDRLVEVIGSLLRELRPDEVYATCAGEPHPDHAAVGRAARRAAREAAAGGAPVEVLEYPVWLWQSWPLSRDDRFGSLRHAAGAAVRRRAVVVRAGGFLAAKRDAIQAHRSQVAGPPSVLDTADWPRLPAGVLATATGPTELFFPVRRT